MEMNPISAVSGVSLVLVCIFMGIATYCAGILAVYLKLSSRRMDDITLFSMGILIGTAILFVLPEGVETLYESLTEESRSTASVYIGFSVLTGFVLMFVLDGSQELFKAFKQHSSFNPDDSEEVYHASSQTVFASVLGSSITLGLILHGFVDGIALGSSFAEPDYRLQFTFFVAIIIHKLPTAFSLGQMLNKEGLSAKMLKLHMLFFAILSPCAALGTFLLVSLVARADDFAVAILFLFSAGTFLYVVSHVMSEVAGDHGLNEMLDAPAIYNGHKKLSIRQIIVALGGVCIPALILLVVGES